MKRIAPDKKRHFFAGIALGAVLQTAAQYFLPWHTVTVSLLVLAGLIAINYGFEIFSLVTGMGRYDFMDAVAGTLGGILGMGAILFFHYI